MKLPELKEIAKELGLRGLSAKRKGDLVAAIEEARAKQSSAKSETAPAQAEQPAGHDDAVSVPVRKTGARRVVRKAGEPKAVEESAAEQPTQVKEEGHAALPAEEEMTQIRGRRVRGKRRQMESADQAATNGETSAAEQLLSTLNLPEHAERGGEQPRRRRGAVDSLPTRRRAGAAAVREPDAEAKPDLDDILSSLPLSANDDESDERHEEHAHRRGERGSRTNDRSNARADRENRQHRRNRNERDYEEREEGNERRSRDERGNNRNERNNRNDRNERREENTEDLVEVGGIVDVLDSYAFIRTSGYLPGPNDIYVSMGQIKKYGLRKGDAVRGYTRAPHEGERRNQRQKFMPLQSITLINGLSVEEAQDRPNFSKLTPLYPDERLRMETTPNRIIGRLIDIVSPIGKGQRGLIVSPPKAGKTITLQNIANAIAVNNPEVHLMVVLVDERPEEVTDMERTVKGEIISSTFDRPASDHTIVAELAIERAKRLVELGQDVVVLLDSMTRLARAYNIAAPASGRILSGGVDAQALNPPKKFFGAARNIENGGSLTIISSALVETGSKMDEVIFEEFKGTGNMELRLSRELADKRLFPAVDINASGTRREELITNPQELPVLYSLRRLLGGLEPEQAYQTLVPRLKKTMTNADFFKAIVQQGNSSLNGGSNN